MMDERVSRGSAVADLDNDGRLDIVINDLDGTPQVLHNEVTPSGHWLIVALQGKPPNTLAIGTVVTARVGDRRMMRVVQSGTSYLSQDDMRLHFGLGAAEKVDELEMRWPDGTRTVLKEPRLLRADQILAIEQR
jgi:enediyne biosynthesis protein E4